jgi:alpha/beta hydrolase family protein
MMPTGQHALDARTSMPRVVRFCAAMGASAFGGVWALPSDALAKVVGFEIVKVESPAFGGRSFGSIGSYDRILARVTIGIDPLDRHNVAVVDIDLAPRNAQGLVEATSEVEILRPTDPGKGSDKLFFEVLNRGRKPSLALFNESPGKDDLAEPANIGNGFLMERGYTLVWAGWQPDSPPGEGRLNLALPTIPNVTGPSVEELVFDDTTNPVAANLTYPAADLDPEKAKLTVREREADERQAPTDLKFTFESPTKISISRPAGFDAGAIYELVYTAKDAKPMGLGFAVPRDIVSFLRHEKADAKMRPNPLADRHFAKAIGFGLSQSGRYLRDYLYLGFNEDEAGRVVFEGLMPHIAGAKKTFVNYRFGQPGRNVEQHRSHSYPGDQFPFTYSVLTDAVTGRTDGILARCLQANNCPKVMQTDTEYEVYQSQASLVVTDTKGDALDLPENVRTYLVANTSHFVLFGAKSALAPACQYQTNPLHAGAPMRALLVAMDAWLDGTEPPTSRYPSRKDGTFVPPQQDLVGIPSIPVFKYTGVINTVAALDYSTIPPKIGASYPVYVGRTDGDGHTVAGIRVPALDAPTATYFGFNYRKAGYAEGELCDFYGGSTLPLVKTKAARLAAGDPRPSLEERYPTPPDHIAAVEASARKLVQDRLLLEEDAKRIIEKAAQEW